jgi:hypothetical protein
LLHNITPHHFIIIKLHRTSSSNFIKLHHTSSSSFSKHHLELRSTSPQASINITSSFDQHHLKLRSTSASPVIIINLRQATHTRTTSAKCLGSYGLGAFMVYHLPSSFTSSVLHLAFTDTFQPPEPNVPSSTSILNPRSSLIERSSTPPSLPGPRPRRATMMVHGYMDGSTHYSPLHTPPTHTFWISGTHHTRCRRTELHCQWPTV